MVSVEWLVTVQKELLQKMADMLRALNGGYIKVINEGENEVTIALPEDPATIKLPQDVQRKKVKNNPSCCEVWNQEEGGKMESFLKRKVTFSCKNCKEKMTRQTTISYTRKIKTYYLCAQCGKTRFHK